MQRGRGLHNPGILVQPMAEPSNARTIIYSTGSLALYPSRAMIEYF
jgi:hypothetical protein